MRNSSSLDVLLPRTRQAILAATYLHPARWWFMRELARQLGVPASSLQRELISLVKGGILRRKREGRQVYFQAATDSPIFADLRGIILKTAGLADVIRAALKPFSHSIRWAFIYGSVARAEEHSASDVDLMIVGPVRLGEISPALRKVERKMSRAVNPAIYSPQEWANKIKSRRHFVTTVLGSKKIFVMGDAREFNHAFGRQAS
ncbi:MAG TPA: ArsR family transcriptional regulator [Terriglobia bacterium]|nr:ArsR family transcriptional regulator [Terriglobia bacterium]